MALNIYLRKEDISKDLELIDSNDILFNYDLYNGLEFNDEIKEVMYKVDGATYIQGTDIRSKYGNITSAENLSTGCKTMINILNHPEAVISCIECGDNVLHMILKMHNIRGSIYLPFLPSNEDIKTQVNVIYKNKRYKMDSLQSLLNIANKILG